jgi:hypothetical protein
MTTPQGSSSEAAAPATAGLTAEPSIVMRRTIAAIIAFGTLGVLLLAAWFQPAAEGLGTHEQLNLPRCSWIASMDMPCPTCGMTTAFAHAADGSLLASFRTQPLGALAALACAMTFLVASYVALTGSPIAGVFGRLWTRYTGWLLALAVLLAWGYKILSYRGLL